MASERTMTNDLARIEIDGHRADVIIDRPEQRNGVTEAVMAALTEAFRAVGATKVPEPFSSSRNAIGEAPRASRDRFLAGNIRPP